MALYPSMDILGTSEIVTQAVINSKVKFRNINREMLVVYLFLVLGGEVFRESGLDEYIPERSRWRESKSKSLASKINRDLDNWRTNVNKISWEEERMLLALLIKVSTLALMDSTCYSFGGEIFKQVSGAGIGLRASACMAKLLII